MQWIKVRTNLLTDPRVLRMARSLGVTRQHVVGCLLAVWTIADEHAVVRLPPGQKPDTSRTRTGATYPEDEGFLSGYAPDDIDEAVGQAGFAEQMASIEWLVVYSDGVGFPDWDIHNSKSAKQRSCDQKRKAKKREERRGESSPLAASVRNVSGSQPDKTRTREEKRREEYKGMNPLINPSCSEVENPPPEQAEPHAVGEVVLTFPTSGKPSSWDLLASQVAEWQEIFPGLDVEAQCREALGWVKANNRRKKTAGGMRRFLYSWLQRENDAPAARRSHANPRPAETPNERLARLRGANALQQSASEKE